MTEFVIVVEVDHQRAQRAFQKAYDDVMRVWPQVLEKASGIDTSRIAKETADRAEAKRLREEAEAKYEADKEAHLRAREALDAWNKTPWYERSSKPVPGKVPPFPMYPYTPGMHSMHLYTTPYETDLAYSYLARLKKLKDIACAAMAPYRMVESDALQMVAWENGEEWERFHKRFLASASPVSEFLA